jgi:hypothetical protein
MTAIVVLYLGLGILLTFLGIPLWRGLIPPNRWFGVRLPSTMADVPSWYAANARFGRTMTLIGIPIAIAAGAALAARWTTPAIAAMLAAGVIGGVVVAGIDAARVARRVART